MNKDDELYQTVLNTLQSFHTSNRVDHIVSEIWTWTHKLEH